MKEFLKSLFSKIIDLVMTEIERYKSGSLPAPSNLKFDPVALQVNLKNSLGTYFKDSQMEGYFKIIAEFQKQGFNDIRWLAYILATTLHETAHTMKPVKEYGSEAYLKSKKYYPWVGRGYVQLTWDYNYAKYGIRDDMDKAMDPDFAAFIIIDGMTKGKFSGPKLSQFFTTKVDDPFNARTIVNGLDMAGLIRDYHYKILSALNSSTQSTLS